MSVCKLKCFGDVGSVELLAFCFLGGLVMKTQILKNERTWFGGKLGFDLGWAVRCWLCGMVLVGSVGANGWAQLPESASIDPATLDKEMFDKEMSVSYTHLTLPTILLV